MDKAKLFSAPIRLILVVVAVLAYAASVIYGEFLWFGSIGYADVFTLTWAYRIGLFTAFTIATFVVMYVGYRWARSNMDKRKKVPSWLIVTLSLVSVAAGAVYSQRWATVLQFIHSTPFGTADPIFSKDIAFYVFQLPFYRFVASYLLGVISLSFAFSLVVYATQYGYKRRQTEVDELLGNDGEVVGFNPYTFIEDLKENAYNHIYATAGILFLVVSSVLWLGRYDLLFSGGTVFGVGFTDSLVGIPLIELLSTLALLGGLACLANLKVKKDYVIRGVMTTLALVAVLGFIGTIGVQSLMVEPDEFNKESEYIQNEIRFTRQAFGLDRIEEESFPVSANLSREDLENNPETVSNVRLWDWRPLHTTYNELQIFRTYYTFKDVDVDRYDVDGVPREMMTSPREIDFSALPQQSQTWVNRHLVYTHGFGITMSPVSKVTPEGLPPLAVKDIPPQSSILNITQPRIYFGENTNDFAVVNTKTRELDFPSGEQNEYTTYTGNDGVELDAFRKLVYGISFRSPQLFFSDSITDDSRVLLHRNIRDRISRVAPFLRLDSDPYVIAADGRLFWIQDAYTVTNDYPYSRSINYGGDLNYIRNSVKVVVDAYNGDTTFYVAEEEPIVDTYSKIFPDLFTSMEEMPEYLRSHVRYPEGIFRVQAARYLDYHMRDPQVFYNKEDQWRIPREVFRGDTRPMEPYYLIMKLPGEDSAEFVQILPFVPRGKENMIGWMAARSDRPHYGSLKAFLFSKQELVFGPLQIESRIDQDPDISQQITLWSQSGSEVLRGNLLAIPIEDTILYVEPLFLQSREQGSLPELKRVIVAHGDLIAMEPTLDEALSSLLGEEFEQRIKELPESTSPNQVARAQRLYDEAQAALQRGDFQEFGEKWAELGRVLDDLEN